MPFLKLARSKKPSSYSIHPAIAYSLMPFPRCHRRQPLQDLTLLVRHGYLAIIPHILITVRYIADVLIYCNGRLLVRCRTHLALHVALVAVINGSGGEDVAFRRVRGVTRGRRKLFRAGSGKSEGRRKAKAFRALSEHRHLTGLKPP